MRVNTEICGIGLNLYCAASLAFLAAGTAAAQPKPGERARPAAADAPWRHVLTGDDAKRVAELEEQITKLRQGGKYAEAQKAARAIVELRTRRQGSDHWQTADARRLLHRLAKIAALPEEARLELAEAGKVHAEGLALYRRGQETRAFTAGRR